MMSRGCSANGHGVPVPPGGAPDFGDFGPKTVGIVLMHTPVSSTFGDKARESYETTIDLVDRAERRTSTTTTRGR